MTDQNYRRPPIVEAILDIQISEVNSERLESLKEFSNRLKDQFPIQNVMTKSEGSIAFSNSETNIRTKSPQVIGFNLSNHDDQTLLRVTNKGIGFSKLAPYNGWLDFSAQALELCEKYLEWVEESRVDRVALRYINRIDLPENNFEIEKYLKIYPEVSEAIGPIGDFRLEVTSRQPDIDGVARIQQGLIGLEERNGLPSITLDIDLYKTKEGVATPLTLRAEFDSLRDAKNRLFENSITNQARELFS